MSVPVAMIVAMGANNVIGADGQIPWRLPTDFAHFKRSTLGKPLIMGRKTFESIGKPLPGRTNIVVSRRRDYDPDGVVLARDIAEAVATAQSIAARDGAAEVMVGGGGEIYRAAMPLVERLYVTHVVAEPAGDALFPQIDEHDWQVVEVLDLHRGDLDSADFSVKVYERRSPQPR